MRRIFVPLILLAVLVAAAVPSEARRERAVRVPPVVGKSVDRAIQDLEAVGLEAVVIEVADAAEGRVAAQVPEAGLEVERGSAVEIRVGVMVRIETRVPNVLGWTADRAARALVGAYVVEVEEVLADAAREGTVLETVPAPGARHPFRGVLLLRVAVAPELALVPRVEGLPLERAERALIGVGFTALPTFVPAWGVPPGTVLQQMPRAGQQAEVGSQVALTVAMPRRRGDQVRVPNLFGLPEADASRVLAGLGLMAQIERVPARAAPGRVLRQEPEADAAVRPGTVVRVFVAIPSPGPIVPRGVPVPSLLGMDAATARLALTQAGFRGQMRLEERPDQPFDRVYAQDPAAGAVVPEGTRVVFLCPTPADVPDLTGRTAAEAQALLAGAGLQAAIVGGRGGDLRGVVAVQAPEPGARVARGSAVQVTLAVNPGVRRTALPSVVGLTAVDAQTVLAAQGLVAVLDGPRLPPQLLSVVAQDPPAGTYVPRGAEVRLRVAPLRR